MWTRIGIAVSICAGLLLLAGAVVTFVEPANVGLDLAVRDVAAAERASRWAIIGALGALLGNVLLFLNLRIAAEATTAAREASRAALEGIEHARQTARLELRPYVIFKHHEWQGRIDEDQIVGQSLRLVFENVGRTPAKNMRGTMLMSAIPGGPADGWAAWDFGDPSEEGLLTPSLPPSRELIRSAEFPVDLLQRIWRQEVECVVYGWFEYDGFPEDGRHRTEFAFRVEVWSDPTKEGSYRHVSNVLAHNGMDEQCMYLPRTGHGHHRKPTRRAPRPETPVIDAPGPQPTGLGA